MKAASPVLLSSDSTWPEGDWRNIYFTRSISPSTLARVERLGTLVPTGMDLSELALRFVLAESATSRLSFPGCARRPHVERNLAAAATDRAFPPSLLEERCGSHRWDRTHVIAV